MSTVNSLMIDVSGNMLLDDGPRWPRLKPGHTRIYCPSQFCGYFADHTCEQEAVAIDHLNAHMAARHPRWPSQEN